MAENHHQCPQDCSVGIDVLQTTKNIHRLIRLTSCSPYIWSESNIALADFCLSSRAPAPSGSVCFTPAEASCFSQHPMPLLSPLLPKCHWIFWIGISLFQNWPQYMYIKYNKHFSHHCDAVLSTLHLSGEGGRKKMTCNSLLWSLAQSLLGQLTCNRLSAATLAQSIYSSWVSTSKLQKKKKTLLKIQTLYILLFQ